MSKQIPNLIDTLLSNINHGVIICDSTNSIQQINRPVEEMTGYHAEELFGKNAEILSSKEHNKEIFSTINEELNHTGTWLGTVVLRCHDGTSRPFQISAYLSTDQTEKQNNYVVIIQYPASQTKNQVQASNNQYDEITGLPSKTLFKDRAEQSIIATKRADKFLAVLIFGMDRFSIINDGLGHDFGNYLLKEVSTRLKNCIRNSDTVARFGDDRFVILLQISAIDDSVIVAEKILNSMKPRFTVKDQNVTATASIGISLYPTDGDDVNELTSYAESAMHHVKKKGGNNYLFFANNMNLRAKERINMENSLRQALQNEEFVLYYQPKVNADSQKITGMEALMRWNDPEKGIISPGIFIPIAEETGLIEPIGLWGLNEACRQNREWQEKSLQPVRVSVNVSAHQFRNKNFVDYVKTALKNSGLEAKYLELELTESLFMDDIDETVNKLQIIRDIGCHLSIDDFGTGYSSLSYLTRFPISVLKIDKAFVQNVEASHSTAEIARAIIGLSKGLKLEIVAEGAETNEHVDFLRQHGCKTVQGFYYSRPIPADKFEELLTIGFINKEQNNNN